MLSQKKLTAFVPTINPAKARAFYRDVLGLKLLSEDNFALMFDANGTLLRVAIVPELTPQKFTILGWEVDDIVTEIESLEKNGVLFERYDFMNQNKSGVWTSPSGAMVAWFKDPDGNILSLSQIP